MASVRCCSSRLLFRRDFTKPLHHTLLHCRLYGGKRAVPPADLNIPIVTEPSVPGAVYGWHEGTEDLESYVQGGYHPVHIGDKYGSDRYEVVHKLGHGSYSTVWLARDARESRFVALKITRADASGGSRETSILSRLASGRTDHPGRHHITTLLDEFHLTGPNGRHRCIVTEAAGCSIAQSKQSSTTWMFPTLTARAIAAQFLRGLAYIHSCGVVHADLHTNNILFKLPCFRESSTERLYQAIGEPQRLPVQRLDQRPLGPEAPQYCVPSVSIAQVAEEVRDPKIIIADFGEAFMCDAGPRADVALRTPVLLLPPEAIFGDPLNQAVDIWTGACTLYEILGERPLFEGFVSDEDHTVAEMISTLGPLPEKWWRSWPAKSEYFHDDGSWNHDTERRHEPCSRPLSERLRAMGRGNGVGMDEFTSQEFASLESLLRSMLTYEPTQRIDVKAIQNEPWMVQYGLPAL